MPSSNKDLREMQNIDAVGGLRNPNRAVARSPALRAVGHRIRGTLEKLAANAAIAKEMQEAVRGLGSQDYTGFTVETLTATRAALLQEFGSSAVPAVSGFDAVLWKVLLVAAEDVETEVPDWLATGCPTGIGSSSIRACGVFPPISKTSAAIRNSQDFARQRSAEAWREERHRNYKSFYVGEGKAAKNEVDRIASRGFVEQFQTWVQVVERWPNASCYQRGQAHSSGLWLGDANLHLQA